MLIHIVKTGETVDKISDSYRILKSDLISNNLHITDFSHLKSGTKLKIPLISKDIIESLEESEAFIDDYYPSFEKFLDNNKFEKEEVIVKEIIKHEEINLEEVNKELKKEVERVNVVEDVNQVEEENQKTKKQYNNNVYYNRPSSYNGNVVPRYNEKFIKKI